MSILLPTDLKYQKRGVRSKDIPRIREAFGDNSFKSKPRKTFFKQYLSAFGDPIIKILLVALALNLLIAIKNAEIYEPLGIAVTLFIATFVSTLSEYGSESAFIKLEEQSSATECRVIRDNKLMLIPVTDVVVTDTVCLMAGERVPADGVIMEGEVSVDQSALTGESKELTKKAGAPEKEWSLENESTLFRGSVVTSGECLMTVGRTGDNTLYGNVANELQTEKTPSPLTKRLSALAKVLARLGYAAATLVFFADLFNSIVLDNGFDKFRMLYEISSLPMMAENLLHAITLAITVVVVAIPEGLPMMITVVLSSNMRRLKKDNVLVRKLVGIETGGSLNILFCDKTGTLTEGKLAVTGCFDQSGAPIKTPSEDFLFCTVLNNDSKMTSREAIGGNATDRALMSAFFNKKYDFPTISKKIPFDSEKKYSAVRSRGVWYIKGAPEVVFGKGAVSSALLDKYKELTQNGMRVIACAKSDDLVRYEVLGIVAIADKLRRDVRRSVRTVKEAGIQVCMVTGDNEQTARFIAQSCGILSSDSITLTSSKLNAMTDSEVIDILPSLAVVARALPSDKSRLVRLSKSIGLVCGMTGDGINDAPALKLADIGFAMGSGTEVAKQAGDIVILDNNFTSIAKAILYGRTIFKSIRKFIVFQLTMNLCAVGVSVIGPFIGIDTPVTVMQMLWINIIMDTLAGLAYSGEAPKLSYMKEKPLPRTERVLDRRMAGQIIWMGVYSLVLCTVFLSGEYFKRGFGYYADYNGFMTSFFALFIFTGIFASFNARCDKLSLLSGLYKNRAFVGIMALISIIQIWLIYFGGAMFRTVPIPIPRLCAIICLSMTVIPVDYIRRLIFTKKHT